MYGRGGIGKSTLIKQAAEHLWKTRKLKTRVIGADGGGQKAFQVLINKGIVEYCPIDLWDEKSVFYYLDSLTKGMWPEDVNTPNSPLLECKVEYRPCPKCGADSGAVGLGMVANCKSCKEAFGAGVRLPKKIGLINGFENIGLVAFESAYSFGNMLLNRLKKVDSSGGYNVKDGETSISSPGQQHYGQAQTYMAQFIANTRQIPVPTVMWTSIELRGSDDVGKPIYGPAFPGKKLTETCIPWFTDVIHIDSIAKKTPTGTPMRDANGVDIVERKLFLATHYPEDTKPYGFVAKSSAPLGGGMPSVMDFTEEGNTMTRYFEALEASFKKVEEKLGF